MSEKPKQQIEIIGMAMLPWAPKAEGGGGIVSSIEMKLSNHGLRADQKRKKNGDAAWPMAFYINGGVSMRSSPRAMAFHMAAIKVRQNARRYYLSCRVRHSYGKPGLLSLRNQAGVILSPRAADARARVAPDIALFSGKACGIVKLIARK